jgi:hypothetical protein
MSLLWYFIIMTSEKPEKGHIHIQPDPESIARIAKTLDVLRGSEQTPRELLLYINPMTGISDEPVMDEITSKMTSAFRAAADTGEQWRGVHQCVCGACSDNTDYILPSGHQTNSLAVHYVALHRAEVPEDQLEIISTFDLEPVNPAVEDLRYPPQRS